jgi:hypothetical protein
MRALMDFFPGMGPWMNQRLGVNKTLREVQDFRRSQNPPADQGRVIWLP